MLLFLAHRDIVYMD